jgi:dihydrofolate reductase
MNIKLIVAATENNVIGNDNKLIWRLPNDMKHFKNTTWGSTIIMGRKTFESFGHALSGRVNIVITKNKDWGFEDIITASNVEEALIEAKKTNCKDIFIIGGGEIYKEFIGIANQIYITRVHTKLEGDTYFPVIGDEWKLITNDKFEKDDKHAFDYTIQLWEK